METPEKQQVLSQDSFGVFNPEHESSAEKDYEGFNISELKK